MNGAPTTRDGGAIGGLPAPSPYPLHRRQLPGRTDLRANPLIELAPTNRMIRHIMGNHTEYRNDISMLRALLCLAIKATLCATQQVVGIPEHSSRDVPRIAGLPDHEVNPRWT